MTIDPVATTPITLTRSEALVLFEWLQRNEDSNTTPGDDAERAALWNLSALLERELVEPFKDDYSELLAAAKAELAAQGKPS